MPSGLSVMPHLDGPPRVFIDRSLGRIAVPGLLSEAGIQLAALAEHHGIPQDSLTYR
jgi:hypothetical protein